MVDTGYSQKKFTELSNGLKLPRLGLGTSQSQESAFKEAITIGYRHLDTAKIYNEVNVGKILKEVLADGTVKREDLFITTKIWVDELGDVEAALKGSLQRLQLDYVDLYLIHWPIGGVFDVATGKIKKHIPLHVTWKALEAQVKAGRTKAIGLSNFNVQLILDLLSYAEIKPVCNEIEVHPYNTQEDLVKFCKKNDIEVVAYSPLGGNNPAKPEFSVKTLLEEPVIKELATKYNKTPSQVILNWHLSRGYSVIPKSATVSRIKENFDCTDFEISAEDAQRISALNKNFKVWDLKSYDLFGYTPMFA